jgi:hypothetical protein
MRICVNFPLSCSFSLLFIIDAADETESKRGNAMHFKKSKSTSCVCAFRQLDRFLSNARAYNKWSLLYVESKVTRSAVSKRL